jgi:oligopeptidase A
LAELRDWVASEYGDTNLEVWDVPYYSEKLKQARYQISQELLRSYFPLPKVLDGLFTLLGQLFGISVRQETEVQTWHPDARFYAIEREGRPLAYFYLDLFAREGKRGGAWMAECRVRRRTADGLQLPVAYLVCNFNAPVGDTPSLLTHNEVTTLFHEFGHGLHHMLTQVEVAAVSGINGVAWDAVELPSQFMENWCWQRPVLQYLAGHYQTGEPLPEAMIDRLLAAKNFQAAMMTLRQVEFALFDFRLHMEYGEPGFPGVQALLDQVRSEVAVLVPPAFNRFQNGFTHIFAGGYAAGYYSYKWAEVLSADAFAAFEENGLFDVTTGQRFLREILEKGGSEDAMVLFKNFRGREPDIQALLRHAGIQG